MRLDHDFGLYLINKALRAEDYSLEDFFLPYYQNPWDLTNGNLLILHELSYNQEKLAISAMQREQHLNADQH